MAQFDIFNLTKHVEDDEMRFTLLIEFMNNLYSNTKEDSKNKVTKNLVAKILEVYSHEDSRFRTDPRLLHAWDLLGRTSIFLKYDAVMQNVDGLGYFKTSPEFFRLWAAYLAEKKDRTNF
uniref:Uncharacterized protein n=1 Tax=Panagrolaimus sp. ES5 TaxID=591445 RepID=A0AC34GHV9_9BILA